MKENKTLYEGMFIVSGTLSADAKQKACDRIESSITERGGNILKVHNIGNKRMAYEINRQKEGYYQLLYFEILPSMIKELEGDYLLHEDLLRFGIFQTKSVMEDLEFKPLMIAK